MAIVFDDSLKTGNQLIDDQHRELIERVNKLEQACAAGGQKRTAIQTLDFLMDYVHVHFADEEELQEEWKYPQTAAHKAQHRAFEEAVEQLNEMLEEEEGPTEAFVEAVKKNVGQWLVDHICVWDKQLAQYIREA